MASPTPPSIPIDNRWQIWIDRGGTFTDVVAQSPGGAVVTTKYLSEDPARPGDAAVNAIRDLTGAGSGALPPLAIRMGSTVATNALLERKGEPTLLAITHAELQPMHAAGASRQARHGGRRRRRQADGA